jgi:hypothetical protein
VQLFTPNEGNLASWTVGMFLLWIIGAALVAFFVIIAVDLSRRGRE